MIETRERRVQAIITPTDVYKKYNLTGKIINIKIKDDTYNYLSIQGLSIPVKITDEHRKFLTGIVLPHYNPNGLTKSKEYPITLDKYKLFSGAIKIHI